MPDGGNGDAPQRDAHAFGIGENPHGLHDLRQVQQGFAHAHKNQVQPRAARDVLPRGHGQHLPDDFTRGQIAFDPSSAVKQNRQSSAQPTWLDRQSVVRSSSGM